MNRYAGRILVLVLCAAMLCGMLPGVVIPVSAKECTVKSFEELKELVENSTGESHWIYYSGESALTIAEDLTLPSGTVLNVWDAELIIPENVTLDATGSDISTNLMAIHGLVKCRDLSVSVKLEVTGELQVAENVGLFVQGQVIGEENVVFGTPEGRFRYYFQAATLDELSYALEKAAAVSGSRYIYTIAVYPEQKLTLAESTRVPAVCALEIYSEGIDIAAGAEVVLDGQLYLYSSMHVAGALENNNRIEVRDEAVLTIAEGGVYSGMGDIRVYVEGQDALAAAVPGLDLEECDAVWNTDGGYWSVKGKDPYAWGDNLRWNLSEDGVLTISGSGEMMCADWSDEYEGFAYPWTAFRDRIQTLVVETGVTTIAEGAFRDCAMNQATLPETLLKIGTGAFAGCGLTEVEIPDSVTNIGMSAFYGCEALTYAKLPAGLTFAGEGVFSGCTALETVVMPEMPGFAANDQYYFYAMFEGCGALNNIDFHTSSIIGYYMYADCAGLTKLTIPDCVTTIYDGAFHNCANLSEVVIPESVTELMPEIFTGEASLTDIWFEGDAPTFDVESYSGRAPLDGVTATAYYPADNGTWTETVMASYGGTIEWKAVVAGDMSGDGVVNDEDVAQLLWYTLFPEDFPVLGNADFDDTDSVDDADVAYLLWHTLFPELYPL